MWYIFSKGIGFVAPNTACWRGYYGTWEIKDNKLYLVAIEGYIEGYKEVGIDYIAPGQKEIFAEWVNEKIRIPKGKLLKYLHSGYESIFEKDLFLVIENGVLIKEYEVDNSEL